jgi:hypothetical protein
MAQRVLPIRPMLGALVSLAVASLVLTAAALAADPPASVAEWSRFEASYVPSTTPANPFDPGEIDVRAEFVSPGGTTVEAIGFWFQDYTRALVANRERLTPAGSPSFRVRFTPTRPGRWRWRWVVRAGGTTTPSPYAELRVTPVQARGFLRVSKRDRRQLAFDDGSPYFAVGENTGWYDARGTYAYDDWFGRLSEQGANFGRIWMASWAFGLEWANTGLGDYDERLDRAWRLDRILDEAERTGIYVMISLLNHGAFSSFFNSEWDANPYNAVNGGPLASPAEFFTSVEARKLFERRLRYVVARWGYSTHVHSWELWNEVDLTDGYRSEPVAAWHARMAAVLRALDPNDHLVTTSHAFSEDARVLQQGGLDYTQLHFYGNLSLPASANLPRMVLDRTAARSAATRRPVLVGEIGVDSRGPDETRAVDPQGIGVHDGLWAGVFSGGIGTGMTWWWDNLIAVEPERYYPMFGSVARFIDGIRWDREHFRPAGANVTSDRPVTAYGLRGKTRLLLWIKDDAFQWNHHDAVEIADAVVRVDRRWCGQWYDPWTGTWLDRVKLDGPIAVPAFTRDIALLAARCPAKELRPD